MLNIVLEKRNKMLLPSRSLVKWIIPVFFVLCATGLRFLLHPWANDRSLYSLYLFAIAATAFGAGFLPSLLGIVLSVIAAGHFLIDPQGHLRHGPPDEAAGVFFFALAGVAIAALVLRMKRNARMAKETRVSLEWERSLLHAVMAGAKNLHLACVDRDFNFIRVNETYARTCGYRPEAMIGKNHFVLYPHAENEEIFRRVRDTGEPAEFHDKPFEFPDQPERGVTYWDWTLSPMKNSAGEVEALIFALSETTARKRAEIALRRSEEEFRSLFELSAVGAGQADPATGRLLRVNHRLSELTGYPEEKLLTMRFSDLTHPEDREREMSIMGPLLRGEIERCQVEKRYIRMDGKVIWVNVSVRLIRDDQGRPYRTMAGIVDISPRKQHEARIEKLSRLYAMLSRVNEAIVRIRDQADLYREICRIIAETGNYPLVWVGEVCDEKIIPVAFAGNGARYLDHIEVTLTGEYGSGPTGTCIRENNSTLNRDFVSNERTSPWRASALDHGFGSSVAFPLRKRGQPVAALTLYTDVPDAFDDEHMRLIEGLCADLSYALDALDHEKYRSEAEQALRESEARFRSLFTTMSEGFALHELIYDGQGKPCDYRFLEINPAFEKATGLKAADLIGRALREVLPGTESTWVHKYGQVVLTGEPAHFEEYHEPTGNWYEVFASRTAPHQFAVVFLNISERKRAEDAFRQTQERLRITFDRAGVGIVEVEGDDHLVAANDRACEIFGYSREELLALNINQLTYPEDRAKSEQINAEIHQGLRDRSSYEKRYLKKDGSPVWVQATVSAIRDGGGRWIRSITTIEDIGERKRAEDALQKVMADLRETDRRKDEFLAMLAHELRNPMATVSAAATLLGRMELPSQAQKARDAMARQVRHLGRLIDDLLDISRITRGKVTLDKEILDLREPLERAIEVTRPVILEAGQKLILEISQAPLYASGDTLRLQQIFINLLANAARYSTRGGEITVCLWQTGKLAILKVKDTGIGIEKSMQEKIFEPFLQIDPGLHRSKGGLGIGLTVVKLLTELHGGSVSVFSAGAGQGTTFTVSLPLEDLRPEPAERPTASVSGGLTILVVEDNRDTAVLTAALLENLGHKALVAYDGESGLELALRYIPDVALLDIGLPGLDGYEVARGIRAAGLGSMLVVAVSGYGQERDKARSKEAGFDAHFLKPLEYDSLAPVFAEWQESERSASLRSLRMERSPEHWQ